MRSKAGLRAGFVQGLDGTHRLLPRSAYPANASLENACGGIGRSLCVARERVRRIGWSYGSATKALTIFATSGTPRPVTLSYSFVLAQ
jgi:hypothetical protein